MKKSIGLFALTFLFFAACKKDTKNTSPTSPTPAAPQLKFVFKFDSTQARLGDSGQVVTLASTHRAQNPRFNGMSAHYIEISPNAFTQVGSGAVLYSTPTVASSNPVTVTSGTTSTTYTNAIDFSQESIMGQGGQFFSIPLSKIAAGTYQYLRISVSYQNYDITYAILPNTAVSPTYTTPNSTYYSSGTIASFIGYNTEVSSYKIKNQTVTVGSNKAQGYWGFESAPYIIPGVGTYTVPYSTGQAPAGSTTVVNPLFASSAIPPGSCLVTGQFVGPGGANEALIITGQETSDIIVTVSMSVNQSFEWKEYTGDNNFNPLNGDTVVNMGVRGMKPILPH